MSFLYDISLSISYKYEHPAGTNRALLRMMPKSLPDQYVVSGLVSTDPAPDFRRDRLDFFGNATTEVGHDAPLSDITFTFRGRVHRMTQSGELDLSSGLSDLAGELSNVLRIDADAPHHFLGRSDRVPSVPEITDFARQVADPGGSVLDTVRRLSDALYGMFEFDASATEVTTTPAEAFAARRGVCQDISHVMIAGLRGIGVPAGYVSGFLRTIPPEGQPRLEGADAMHAWVRAWCGAEMGWVEIDPTNAIMAGGDHIVVAHGRDYADVAPVKGTHRAAGSHSTVQKVDVVPVTP